MLQAPSVSGALPRGRKYSTSQTADGPDPQEAQLDYRKFLDMLRHDNDLVEINTGVDPHLELGAIIRRVSEVNDKAPLFNNIEGARDGLWRVAGNAASLRPSEKDRYGRIARSLGLEPTASWKEICHRWQSGKRAKVLSPNVLPSGPCKDNKIIGDKVDLTTLPVPFLHTGDGGKYIQTYGVHVLQMPDGSWTNWSIFRGMVYDKNRIVCLVGGGQHNSMIRDAWLAAGKKEVPWALAFGVPPAASLAAAMPVPEGVSEAEYVGALVGKPLDLVKCELNNLLVPANSEIVFEGTLSLTDKAHEGPFEDYLGVIFEGDQRLQPLFTVDAITYRNDAIMPVSVPGRITDESHTTAALASAELLELLQREGLPIKEANCPLETYATWCALQVDTEKLGDMKTSSAELCRRIGDLAFKDKSCMLVNRIILIGDDIDVFNWNDVMWALVTRCRPGKDETLFEKVRGHPITPYMSHGPHGDPTQGGKIVSDCLMPIEYQGKKNFRECSFNKSYPDDIKNKVQAGWKDMGFTVQL
ncbi:putative 3-octaprenyl-4-hydroxybenzoate carboxy-lyase [Fusarium oxysporum Fo47]|uniref:putative 3-octaprenyl-4-hydroxybenzoate carboxy-lyase n=1 Tax=Fusarium oxysporum Fo47 TaxID=660027 RepID=UPI00286985B9|nr:putative 3-octaprenyl-4-hydroxybenzoate carboxy-lyase [Fusarium oxysporum Fo47]QKD50526.2 putative 3-octaprenyl-4-hydroxybenzoate carboxy-lyase [Fusarium oxysporum Fo47]